VTTFKKVVELCVYLLLGAVVLAVWWNLLPPVSVRRGGALEREHFIMQWNEEIKHRAAADFVADRRSSSMTFPDAWATRLGQTMSALVDGHKLSTLEIFALSLAARKEQQDEMGSVGSSWSWLFGASGAWGSRDSLRKVGKAKKVGNGSENDVESVQKKNKEPVKQEEVTA
jgi:hypothetical protein